MSDVANLTTWALEWLVMLPPPGDISVPGSRTCYVPAELVANGLVQPVSFIESQRQGGAPVEAGLCWQLTYKGHRVAHEAVKAGRVELRADKGFPTRYDPAEHES